MKRLLSLIAFCCALGLSAQIYEPITWQFEHKAISDTTGEILIKATIDDSWHLYRKYILSKLNEKDLDEFIQESEALFQKYEQDPFANDLLLAITNEIERKEEK